MNTSKKIITEQEKKRLSGLTESEMLMESNEWGPDQWAIYLTKGNMINDTELDEYIENVIIKKIYTNNASQVQ